MALRFDLILLTTGTNEFARLFGGGRSAGRHPDRGLHRPRAICAKRSAGAGIHHILRPGSDRSDAAPVQSRIPAEPPEEEFPPRRTVATVVRGAIRTEDEFRGIVLGVQASLGKAALSYKCRNLPQEVWGE
jgi:hypothetical protein